MSETGTAGAERQLNYFNYFTEVEDAFVRRRGAHMLVSPLDWALIETWKEIGIPLHIVLRAVERSFDAWEARNNRHRRVNSLFYCQQEVETCYAEYRKALVGSAEIAPGAEGTAEAGTTAAPSPANDDDSPFPRAKVERFLGRVAEDLGLARERAERAQLPGLGEAIARAEERLAEIAASLSASARMDAEGLERDLTSLEDILLAALIERVPPEVVEAAGEEAKAALKGYKKQMDKEIYKQTLDKFVARRLRETYHIPRLSLFFMD
jgi:hypothetical protein